MKVSNAFPSKYLKAADLGDRHIKLIMNRVELEDIGDDQKKPVLYFTKAKKGLVLNKTNAKTIATAYGDDMDEWDGKEVILYPAMVDFRGDQVEAIRVRIAKAVAAPVAPPTSENPADGFGDDIADTF